MRSGQMTNVNPPAADAATLVVSTRGLAKRDAFEAWRDTVRHLVGAECSAESPDDFRGEILVRSAGPVRLTRWNVDQSSYERTPSLARHGDDYCTLTISHGGDGVAGGGMEWTRIASGGGFFLVHDRPFSVTASGAAPSSVVVIERKALTALLPLGSELGVARFAPNNPLLELIKGYMRFVTKPVAQQLPVALDVMGQHIVDLTALLLMPSHDASEVIEGRGMKAARLRHVLDAIAARSCDPRFSIQSVASELAVTSRTVQLLLEETGSTFSEHVCEHRLRHAWRLLSNPASRLALAEVAYESGFNDLSNFHRAFRRRFGETPAAVRGSRGSMH